MRSRVKVTYRNQVGKTVVFMADSVQFFEDGAFGLIENRRLVKVVHGIERDWEHRVVVEGVS